MFAIIRTAFLRTLLERIDKMSTATDALTSAVADLQTSVTNLEGRIAALPAPGSDDPAVQAATTALQGVKSQLDALVPAAAPDAK